MQKLKDGLTQRKIRIQLNISRHAVQRILFMFKQHKILENMFKSCSKPKTTHRPKQLLIRNSNESSKKTAPGLFWKLSQPSSVSSVKLMLRLIAGKKLLLSNM